MRSDVYALLEKTRIELEKAYYKINEYEYMISATPINDKQLLTRELAHHIKRYEDLFNSINEKPEITTRHVYTQTVFLRKETGTITNKISTQEMESETDKVRLDDKEIQVEPNKSNIQVQVQPDRRQEMTQTTKMVVAASETPQPKEIVFDISRIPDKAIITYDIKIE